MGATTELAEFSLKLDSSQISKRAREQTVRSFVDTMGVALAGLPWPGSRIMISQVKRVASTGPATVIGGAFRAEASMTALANGTVIHAIDYDDMDHEIGHPSAAVIPAALAVAETVGASGRELVEAIAIGFEVGSRVGRSAGTTQGPYARGFHGTSIYGVFGATAAAGRLMGLEVDALCRAFGIAASEASGVRANFGTHTKPYHAGECNRAAVLAVFLANDGFVADRNSIETKFGWGDAICNGIYDESKLTEGLGESLAIEKGFTIKRYPCCGANHAAISAVVEVMQRDNLKPDDVESIEVYQSPNPTDGALIYPWPSVGLEGKFSLAFNVAEAWRSGGVTVESFTDEHLAELEPYWSRVVVIGEKGLPPSVKVTMHLLNGQSVEYQPASFPGYPSISQEELSEKFRANAIRGGRQGDSAEMLTNAWNVENLNSLQDLTTLFE
jgi:2-methylcitrate dehydratase PrpD